MMNPDAPDPRITPPDPRQHPRQSYTFTPDELRVLKECNREAFYQRSLPISTVLGVGTYYGVKSGFLRPSARLGASPKVIVSVVVGYFLGKFSYQTRCAEKLMQLPNSQIGEMLRKRRSGTLKESMDPGFGPGMSLTPFSGISSSDTYSDLGPGGSSLDIDTNRPQNEGLDDSQRPSLDNPHAAYEEDEMPPVQKNSTSYEELRKKNREEYQQKRTTSLYRDPAQPPPPSRPSEPPPSSSTGRKNKYGDDFD